MSASFYPAQTKKQRKTEHDLFVVAPDLVERIGELIQRVESVGGNKFLKARPGMQ